MVATCHGTALASGGVDLPRAVGAVGVAFHAVAVGGQQARDVVVGILRGPVEGLAVLFVAVGGVVVDADLDELASVQEIATCCPSYADGGMLASNPINLVDGGKRPFRKIAGFRPSVFNP